jgi:hypothetical protein
MAKIRDPYFETAQAWRLIRSNRVANGGRHLHCSVTNGRPIRGCLDAHIASRLAKHSGHLICVPRVGQWAAHVSRSYAAGLTEAEFAKYIPLLSLTRCPHL